MIPKKCFTILFHVIAPLLLGTIIYGLFRGIHFIDPAEKYFPAYTVKFPEFLVYNLPDGLWFYALLSTITFIWNGNISAYYLLWLLLVILLTYLTEIFQALHLIPGTFDWYDLLVYSITLIVYAFNLKNLRNQFQIIKN